MPMCCLWPDCQGTYCKRRCPHQEEIVRANNERHYFLAQDLSRGQCPRKDCPGYAYCGNDCR